MGGNRLYLSFVCLVAALGGLLFGYDTAVINGAIGSLQTYFDLDAAMKGWAASCALVGCFIGVAFAGELSDRLGRRTTMVFCAILFLVSAVGTALPRTLDQFIFFRFLGGLGVGAASMTSPMYIAEISPARFRGRLVSINQFAIVSGMVVVYLVNYFIAGLGDEVWNVNSGWRWMFGSEALPAILLLTCLFLVPESPRFLSKQGKSEAARQVLIRVNGETDAQAEIIHIRKALKQESGSLKELLKPGMPIVLVIGIVLAVLQQITGINVTLYYGAEIFRQTGVEMDIALLWMVIVGVCMMLFTLVAIWTVDKIGRRPLMIIGAAGMAVCLTASGMVFYLQQAGTWVLIFLLAYIAFFSFSVGPVMWVILSEIFPTKIRGRAMAIATFCLWVANYIVSQTFPMMDEEGSWLVEAFHHAFPFWVYAFFCIVLVVFMNKAVPETKGRSLEEIEQMWRENCV